VVKDPSPPPTSKAVTGQSSIKPSYITHRSLPSSHFSIHPNQTTELNKEGIIKWQRHWEGTAKGVLCRSFSPTVEQRLKVKLPITPEFIALVTGHGKTEPYLHRFKLTDSPTCPCDEGAQIPEHLIYACKILEFERSSLKQHIPSGGGSWPTTNSELVAKYLDAFSRFVKSIDFNKLL
jgi:hypothetical protein